MSSPTIASDPHTTQAPQRPPQQRRAKGNGDGRVAALLIAPAVGCLLLWTYLPGVLSAVASFFQIPLAADDWQFVGFGNYTAVASDADVQQAAWNTVWYAVLTIVPSLALGLGAALLVNSVARGSALLSAILFLPLTANLVAMAVVFQWLFAFNGGFANQMIAMVGIAPVNYLGDETTALPTVASVGVWRATSFCMVLFLAGLTTIPASMHEAAAMDGLRGWAKLRLVTIPLLRPIIVLATVVATLQAVQTFDTVRVMTDGGPLGSTESILTITWRIGFGYFQLGAASALSVLLLVILLGLGLLRRRAILRDGA